jgi:hypothetical protein
MIPFTYQIELAKQGKSILGEEGIVYLAMEERTGKTLTAILIAEDSPVETVLVVTKKRAKEGWTDTLAQFKHKKKYTVTNYHNVHKEQKHDLVIVDEAHSYISAFPKPGLLWKNMKKLTGQSPMIYLSATPHAQGLQQLYHQFALSSYSPWVKYPNFYSWFKTFGKPYQIEINGIKMNQYDRCDEELIKGTVEHLFISTTRKELGFEHEPTDKVHYVPMAEDTRWVYNKLLEDNIVELKAGMLVCDTTSKLRFALHMLEGGVAKLDSLYVVLANDEKVQHILKHFGDREDLVIMYNYKAEETKLNEHFKKARILQATSYAEGVDLHSYSDLVVYSQDFSTARHTQRRARQANKKRTTPITVHFLLTKKGISEQVYRTVSVNKKNFVDSVFKRIKL